MRNGTTVKELQELWNDRQHNFSYFDQHILRVHEFNAYEGTMRVELEDESVVEVNPHQIMIETTEETKSKENKAKIESGELVVTYRRCPGFCGGREKRFELEASKVQRWRNGELIQNVWPEMPVADRETLISGMCSECFNTIALMSETEGLGDGGNGEPF